MDFYPKQVATPNSKMPLPDTRMPPKIPHLTLSLTFDVLRGEVKGTLGCDVDAQLGLIDDQYQQMYLDFIKNSSSVNTIQSNC